MRHYSKTDSTLNITFYGMNEEAIVNEMKLLCETMDLTYVSDNFQTEYMLDEAIDRCKKELADSDWIVARSAERGEAVPEAWATYREALRTIINEESSGVINWPDKPL